MAVNGGGESGMSLHACSRRIECHEVCCLLYCLFFSLCWCVYILDCLIDLIFNASPNLDAIKLVIIRIAEALLVQKMIHHARTKFLQIVQVDKL